MNIEDMNSRLTEVKTKIGIVRYSKNTSAICTGLWTLTSCMKVRSLFISPSTLKYVSFGISITLARIYGYMVFKTIRIRRIERTTTRFNSKSKTKNVNKINDYFNRFFFYSKYENNRFMNDSIFVFYMI